MTNLKQLNQLTQSMSKLIGIAILLAMLLLPASTALAGDRQAPDIYGSIKVVKFEDLNGDGVWQSTVEPVIPNWPFTLSQLVNSQWVVVASGVTDLSGHLYFYNLLPGTYQATEGSNIEYHNTTPVSQQTDLVAGQQVILYFGNRLRDVDFGDLPDNYNMTSRAQNGARHQPGAIFLGALTDTELDGVPSPYANSDDLTNLADEDGIVPVANPPNYWTQGQGAVQVTVTGGVGCLFGWVDAWDSNANAPGTDGDFTDSGAGWSEAIIVNLPVNPGTQIVNFALPVGAAKYPVWARFRLVGSFDGDCSFYDANPITTHGFAESGEVEDYYFSFTPTAVSLQSFTAEASGANRNLISLVVVIILAAGLVMGTRLILIRRPRGSQS